ncbi:MAG: hypothetical protein JSW54_02070 [Fidelibacterota bacterium]|nr:MAG: hypothetical protein JSW54_02070 [Candidatus Neomarinimicrobiota bacterium]
MLSDILLYLGSTIIVIWGTAHIAATRPVITGFGDISLDNRRIITMEWIAEGLTFIFIGMLVASVTFWGWSENHIAILVYHLSAGLLVVMAVLSQMTGARTSVLPMQLCPYVKTVVAILFFLGTVL